MLCRPAALNPVAMRGYFGFAIEGSGKPVTAGNLCRAVPSGRCRPVFAAPPSFATSGGKKSTGRKMKEPEKRAGKARNMNRETV